MAKILLLEDDLALAMHYREALESESHIVYHEVNVEQAKITLSEVAIDIVVSDIIIRDFSGRHSSSGGFSLLSHITLNVRPIPHLIVISGTDSSLQLLAVASTFNVAISLEKPLDLEVLKTEVDRLSQIPLATTLPELHDSPSDDTFDQDAESTIEPLDGK